MGGKRIGTFCLVIVLACASGRLLIADEAAKPAVVAIDDATQKRIDGKANKLLKGLALDDAAKTAQVKAILGDWLVVMWNWHGQHDSELSDLWKQWNKARSVVPKDEFPGEVIAEKMDAVYASLKPSYAAFLEKLATDLTPEQIDTLKEAWSRSPGMKRTYDAYLEIAPDLSDADKKVIHDRMALAREEAMLTDTDKEIVSIYKRHKVKVEEYIGALEWAKLHKAFANRGKAAATAQVEPSTQPK